MVDKLTIFDVIPCRATSLKYTGDSRLIKVWLKDLSYGTIISHKKQLFVIQSGLDGKIIVRVNDGTWFFIKDLNWNTFHILFEPNQKEYPKNQGKI